MDRVRINKEQGLYVLEHDTIAKYIQWVETAYGRKMSALERGYLLHGGGCPSCGRDYGDMEERALFLIEGCDSECPSRWEDLGKANPECPGEPLAPSA